MSLEYSSVCVVDGAGKIIREQRIASEPEALIAWFAGLASGLSGSVWRLADVAMAPCGDAGGRPCS